MTLKKLMLLLIIGVFSMPVMSSEKDQDEDLNITDRKGNKQGRWIYLGKDQPALGYPEEGKIEEGNYKDNRKEGLWLKYYKDGITKRIEGNYSDNRPNGFFVKYHANGEVKEIGNWVRNKFSDSLQRFHENGELEYKAVYNEEGKEEGPVEYRYPNGQVEFEYVAINGVQSGKAVRYYENGDVKELISYGADGSVVQSETIEPVNPTIIIVDPGESKEKAPLVNVIRTKGVTFKINGYNKLFNADDEIWQDGEFKNSRLWDGKVYEYDSDGILLKVKVFKAGIYNSDGQL